MGAALSRKWKLKQFSIGVPVLRSSKLEWFEIGDLKKSGRQRQGGLRLKNEFLPLIRISKMAPCVYVSYGATQQLQHTVLKKRWVPNGNQIIRRRGFGSVRRKLWWFHVVVLQGTARKCTKFKERMSASIEQIWNIVASRPKFVFSPTFVFCSPICSNNCGVVFLWKYILVFEKWFFSFDRSNMQIFTVNITRVVWPHVTNLLDLRYFCRHNPLFHYLNLIPCQ